MARTENRTLVLSLTDTYPIKGPPLKEKELRAYLEYLLSDTQNLTQLDDEDFSL